MATTKSETAVVIRDSPLPKRETDGSRNQIDPPSLRKEKDRQMGEQTEAQITYAPPPLSFVAFWVMTTDNLTNLTNLTSPIEADNFPSLSLFLHFPILCIN